MASFFFKQGLRRLLLTTAEQLIDSGQKSPQELMAIVDDEVGKGLLDQEDGDAIVNLCLQQLHERRLPERMSP